jgi:hypothetical protein
VRPDEIGEARRLALLVAAYPEAGLQVEGNLLLLPDGRAIPIDDGQTKPHDRKLEDADIEDMLSQPYHPGPCAGPPGRDVEPGRIRSEPLFRALYGETRAEVEAGLVAIDWFGQTLRVSGRHGVRAALVRVRDAIASRPALVPFVRPSAGAFNWRTVAGTRRLSVHSFGAAIDIASHQGDSWMWAGGRKDAVPGWRNRVPLELVAIFEAEGFIWGGRWYRFDTLHFEYRPELLAIARAAGLSACP